MDRLEAMSLFVAAVEAGSLSAAGRRFGIPLATVSRKVSDLERHLKTRLLNRSTRQLTLTDAGHAYLAACRRILDEVGEAERTAAGEYSAPTGELIITAPIVFGRLHVLPVVTGFLAAYPDVAIRLMLADRLTQLTEEHIDLAVRIGELPDSSLVATRIGSIRRVVCASPAYLAEHGTPETPQDLAAHSCITFEGLTAPAAWTFATGKTDLTVPIRSRLRVNTAEAAVDAAIAGVGLTRVLSYQITAAVRSGTLRTVLEAFEPQPWPVSLVHAGQGLLPVKLRAFLDFAAPRLKKRLVQATWQA
ncbi:MAG: LysR family transcriptional regulator [Mesorhizobium sp.]|uniref:LysR family transcriptional regulator n=1 Tax=Mesorhizobium sp. TaxID=1871066 RepID=UPI000FE77094|nr:LysR family transcriptional regulator [Mesorhizobium sp.]RWM22656.1 MAG: LysR family transcriptional regulator [Mesorhizobium sp.]TIP75502.1 MAG: LysR family transcriptional regulator [Mesorhizobium sp.]TIQ14174.1 MAG: LysR family transcriptional regulator [Mesorhizobium sp.]TIR52897.1 MAG: LysR family transcriptional regulator [Mesorhizobium sp.]TJV98757.1 MAG: LysR family transcriptional regulator [Mesorhizobium sp.]